jgi:hypothetical protein
VTEPSLTRRAAERAASRAFFLASVLLPFAQGEGLDDHGLASYLGCRDDQLAALLLCRRPDPRTFARDVQRIAERFGLDPSRLAEAVRLADSLEALGRAPTDRGEGFLAAARDREEDEEPGE